VEGLSFFFFFFGGLDLVAEDLALFSTTAPTFSFSFSGRKESVSLSPFRARGCPEEAEASLLWGLDPISLFCWFERFFVSG